MTSEVLILNKRAIVLGADSAVTASGGEHPRYSKSANKIFELSKSGSVAAAIYGSAAIDGVPWELAIKLFREQLGNAKFDSLGEYGSALFAFLNSNSKLFPAVSRAARSEQQFDDAIKVILQEARQREPKIFDKDLHAEARAQLWMQAASRIEELLNDREVSESLSKDALDELLDNIEPWRKRSQEQLALVAEFQGVDAEQLSKLGHRLRYCFPDLVSTDTGVVVAGYGEEQIYPAYEQFKVYGHFGDQLCHKKLDGFEIGQRVAMIKPLAQTSMIDMFTDGFSRSLETIIEDQSRQSLDNIFRKLGEAGISVDGSVAREISENCHEKFMLDWKSENWKKNFHPLLAVLQSLSIPEMAHLAESLLNLESLKERVTSPSESVGGPIDVAAITKTEGLVWIKRKHYFEPGLNLRYALRLERSLD